MSRLLARFAGFFSNRTFVGVDKSGNRYFTRKEEIDGVMKEKRWVIFKGEDEPTSVPVEWICWLNGQRKKAPTPEELLELEARRERVKLNVALLKKEEEERRARLGSSQKAANTGKVQGPNLKSFIQQFPASAEGENFKEASGSVHGKRDAGESEAETKIPLEPTQQPETTEPTGSGQSFKPGTWQPPT